MTDRETADARKQEAARQALELVRPGMRLGLGSGSTAAHFVRLLGERVRAGDLHVTGVPTSESTRAIALESGVPLTSLDDEPALDLTVDGADELDPSLRLIKGGGGALLREKIVAAASRQMIVIADDSKRVERLGRFPLPVEVTPFGHRATRRLIEAVLQQEGAAGSVTLRPGAGGEPFRTDEGNLIYDCRIGAIDEPERLASALSSLVGVVEHGLFIGLCSKAIIAGEDGVKILDRR